MEAGGGLKEGSRESFYIEKYYMLECDGKREEN